MLSTLATVLIAVLAAIGTGILIDPSDRRSPPT